MNSQRGFSLLELLVTVAIIGILSVIAVVSLTGVQKNTRDVKRQTDLKLIQGALEQYYADQHFYPATTAVTFSPPPAIPATIKSPTGTRTYLNQIPTDPLTSNIQYKYVANPSAAPACNNSNPNDFRTFCTSYCLYANMENTNVKGSPYTTTCPAVAGYNYLLTQP